MVGPLGNSKHREARATGRCVEAHERVGGPAATRQSVRVRAVIASYTQPTQIRIPIPGQPPISLDSLYTLMGSGNAYVNVHTTAFTSGEIRGQTQQC